MSADRRPSRTRRILGAVWRRGRRAAGPTAAAGYGVASATIGTWLDLGGKDQHTLDPVEERWREEQTRLGPMGRYH